MTVFVLDPISPRALDRLTRRSAVVDWRDAAVKDWPLKAAGIVVRTSLVGAADIARAKHLKVIGKHGVGVDNIDLAAARAKGITVVSTPGANANSVAELALGLALAAARHVTAADRALRAGALGSQRIPDGRELAGRRLGVVGFGAVGTRVAALFKRAFASPVSVWDPKLDPATISARDCEPSPTLDQVLQSSAIVTVHVPLNDETRHMIDARALGLMAPDSILLNTARGGIVDEAALAEALKLGRPCAAASDVFEREPPPADHPLLQLPNFIATPHLGAATTEALDRVGFSVVDQVVDVIEGKRPAHPLT